MRVVLESGLVGWGGGGLEGAVGGAGGFGRVGCVGGVWPNLVLDRLVVWIADAVGLLLP